MTLRTRTRGAAKRLLKLTQDPPQHSNIPSLVQRAKDGDEAALTDIYLRYFDRVYGYVRVALSDSQEAEEASRQVFLRALASLSTYEHREGSFSSWLFGIAREEALDRLHWRDTVRVDDAADVHRWGESVRTDGLRAELRGSDPELAILIEQLPESQRRAVLLRYVLDFEDAEVAEVLSVSASEVRQLQDRALRSLERQLGEPSRKPAAVARRASVRGTAGAAAV
jgi:RNA polymerase sigma-70 factor (ECF subfamily)